MKTVWHVGYISEFPSLFDGNNFIIFIIMIFPFTAAMDSASKSPSMCYLAWLFWPPAL